MNGHLVFATSAVDAREFMDELGLVFTETVWVLNAQLLGDPAAYSDHTVHYSDLFLEMPAAVEAVAIFGEERGYYDPEAEYSEG